MFGERCVVGPEKHYSSTDLYHYIEKLVKQAMQHEQRSSRSNYAWLKSRDLTDVSVDIHLRDLRPVIVKMTPENCAAVAVKLVDLTEARAFAIPDLLSLIKNLLLEQDSIKAMENNTRGKEMDNGKRVSKVHPDLNGRQAMVSFIVDGGTSSTFSLPG